jgi:hypothetical protein
MGLLLLGRLGSRLPRITNGDNSDRYFAADHNDCRDNQQLD